MTSVNPNNSLGLLRIGQLCGEIFNDKLREALQYAVGFSIYDAELTLRELTTSQSLLLSLLYGLLHQDITFCLNLIEASSAAVQLRSSCIKVWLKDDFVFNQDDVAKAFSNLAKLMDCQFPSQLKLPQNIAVAFSGLIDKYKLFKVFNLSGDKKALEFVKALNSFVLELTKELETPLENNSEAARLGSEVVTHDVTLGTRTNQSKKVEESTKASSKSTINDQQANAELLTSAIDDGEHNLSPALPEIQCLVIKEEEAALSLPQPELPTNISDDEEPTSSAAQPEAGNEASGSSSPTPKPPLSRHEVGDGIIFKSTSPRLVSSSYINEDHIYRSLKNAVRHNNPREIRNLMKPGININWECESGDRLLHIAVYYGHRDAVVTLLQCGALPGMKNRDSINPLQLAVRLNFPSIFKALLEYVSNINQVFVEGNTILHEIASEGTSSDMDSVLRYKPNIDLKNKDGETALHLATKSGHVSGVKSLIKAGADVNILSKKGETCLYIAVENGSALILNHLLPSANIRYKIPITKFTALHTAAYNGDCGCIEVLLLQGLNVNVRAYNNRTALHEAAEEGHVAAVHLLLSWGAAVNAIAKNKCTPLHCAAGNGCYEVVTALLDNGAHINAKDSFGNTPLKLAKSRCKFLVDANLTLRGGKL